MSTILTCILLTGCTAGPAQLAPVNPLVHPPWEAFVRAGPGAGQDVDYETLNGPTIATAQPQDVRIEQDIAVAELPKTALATKPVPKGAEVIKAVAVLPVTGGTPSGNAELTDAMRAAFDDAGWPVVDTKRKNAIAIQGTVSLSKPAGNSQTVKLVWLVLSPKGKSLGDVKQENAIPAGSLDSGWGDTALAATQAAAEGISKLIEKYR
jgi:hypothetical protein